MDSFELVRGATRKDPELMRLMGALLTNQYREKLPENLERFERVFVPISLQEEVQEGLHAAHQGMEGCSQEPASWCSGLTSPGTWKRSGPGEVNAM